MTLPPPGSVNYGTDLSDADTGMSQSGGSLYQTTFNPDENPYLFGTANQAGAWGSTNLLTGQVNQTGGMIGGGIYVTPPAPPMNVGGPPGWSPIQQYPQYAPPSAPPQTNVLNYSPTSALDLGSTFQATPVPTAPLPGMMNMPAGAAPQGPAAMNMQQPQFAPLAGYNPGSGGGGAAPSPLDAFGAMARGGGGPGMMMGGGMAPPAPSGPGPQVQPGQGSGPNPMSDMSGGLSRMMGSQAPGAAPLQGNVSMGHQSAPSAAGGVGGGVAPSGVPQPNMPPTNAPSANPAQNNAPGSLIASAPGGEDEDNTRGEASEPEVGDSAVAGSLEDLVGNSKSPPVAPERDPSSKTLIKDLLGSTKKPTPQTLALAQSHAKAFEERVKGIREGGALTLLGAQKSYDDILAKSNSQLNKVTDGETPAESYARSLRAMTEAWQEVPPGGQAQIQHYYPKDVPPGYQQPEVPANADGTRPYTDQGRRPPYQGHAYGQPAPQRQPRQGPSWGQRFAANMMAQQGHPAALNAMNRQQLAQQNFAYKQQEQRQKADDAAEAKEQEEADRAHEKYMSQISNKSAMFYKHPHIAYGDTAAQVRLAKANLDAVKAQQKELIHSAYEEQRVSALDEIAAYHGGVLADKAVGKGQSAERIKETIRHHGKTEKTGAGNLAVNAEKAKAAKSQAETAAGGLALRKAAAPGKDALTASQIKHVDAMTAKLQGGGALGGLLGVPKVVHPSENTPDVKKALALGLVFKDGKWARK